MAWTARKRRSVQGYKGGLATPWPGTVDVGWRAAASWLFAADSYPTPVAPSVATRFRPRFAAGRAGYFAGVGGIFAAFDGLVRWGARFAKLPPRVGVVVPEVIGGCSTPTA